MPPSVDAKTLARIEKLLRLAAPSSRTTLDERTSAALEAARLFDLHDLSVKPKDKPPERKRPPPSSPFRVTVTVTPTPPSREGDWKPSTAARQEKCADCGEVILEGDLVWRRIKDGRPEYILRGGSCGW